MQRDDETEIDLPIEVVFDDEAATSKYRKQRSGVRVKQPDLAARYQLPPTGGAETVLGEPEVDSEAGEILAKLLDDAERFERAGRLSEALDLLELAITLEPRNDVVRARLAEVSSRHKRGDAERERDDETVQLDLD